MSGLTESVWAIISYYLKVFVFFNHRNNIIDESLSQLSSIKKKGRKNKNEIQPTG